MTTLTRVRRDAVDANYAKASYTMGCEVNPVPLGCLTCPLPTCKYDLPNPEGHKQAERAMVTKVGVLEMVNRGVTAAEIALRLGVSVRTVHRYKSGEDLR